MFEQFSTCFNDADAVIVANVYPAGEAPIAGADRDHLVQALRARGHRQVIPLDGPEKLAGIVKGIAQAAATTSCCLGAGNITQWAYALPGELERCVTAAYELSRHRLRFEGAIAAICAAGCSPTSRWRT